VDLAESADAWWGVGGLGLALGGDPLPVRPDLAHDSLEARLAGGVHVGHRGGARRVDRGDPLVHPLRDRTLGGASLPPRTQLDQRHRLAGVEVEKVGDGVAEAEGVGGHLALARRSQSLVLGPRDLEGALVLRAGAGLSDLLGDARAQVRAEALPLAGQHPMALQVSEAAVVGDDLDAVADRLPAAAWAVDPARSAAREVPHARR